MKRDKLKVKLFEISKYVCNKIDDLGYDLEETPAGINAITYCNSVVDIGNSLDLITRDGQIAVIDKRLFNGYFAVIDT